MNSDTTPLFLKVSNPKIKCNFEMLGTNIETLYLMKSNALDKSMEREQTDKVF